jgi:hypothetical protein
MRVDAVGKNTDFEERATGTPDTIASRMSSPNVSV